MTPQERQLVSELFDRLARLETSPRDAQAERAIAEGLARAPNALYPLVQTVLVQDEALKRAEARIRELGGADTADANGGFLDTMRNTLSGATARTSVPSVRTSAPNAPDPRWNSGAALAPQTGAAAATPAPSQGGSFLGTAAATAAGVIGGSLLFNALGGMFGNHNSGSAIASPQPDASPWGNSAAGSDLARDAGAGDIGGGQRSGFFSDVDEGGDIGGDFDGDFGGDA